MSYLRYWGKLDRENNALYHPAAYHCLDVGAVAHAMFQHKNRFAAQVLSHIPHDSASAERICNALTFLITLHDIGKFTAGFQSLCEDEEFLDRLGTPLYRHKNGQIRLAPYPNRHNVLSQVLLKRIILQDFAPQGVRPRRFLRSLDPLIRAVSGHHGRPVDDPSGHWKTIVHEECTDEMLEDIQAFTNDLTVLLGGEKLLRAGLQELQSISALRTFSWLLAGLTSLCDWIGSSTAHFPFVQKELSMETYWRDVALPQAHHALSTLQLGVATPSKTTGFTHLYPEFSTPTPMQSEADEIHLGQNPQLFIIEDLTGAGKTEAALTLANRLLARRAHGSVYIALPTRATANGLFERIHQVAPKLFDSPNPNLILTHADAQSNEVFQSLLKTTHASTFYGGSSSTDPQSTVQCTAWLSDNSKKAFFADVGVGTVDQALLSALPASYMPMRLFGLAGSVLILDEIHAYDAYTSKLIEQLLRNAASIGCDVILLSATLTSAQRRTFANAFLQGFTQNESLEVQWENKNTYPLLTQIAPEYLKSDTYEPMVEKPVLAAEQSQRTLTFEPLRTQAAATETILKQAKEGYCVAWVRNSVDSAIETYQRIVEQYDAAKVHLFHSRFTRADRQRIEEHILELAGKDSTAAQRQGHIVIATQVIEQSLDIDFDYLITDLAPFDLLLQRAGRWRRHKRDIDGNRLPSHQSDLRPKSPVYVLIPPTTGDITETWLDEELPFTRFIYDAPELLWRTAIGLEQEPRVSLPKDARRRLEEVYNEYAAITDLPETLLPSKYAARQKDEADASKGNVRSIDIQKTGYILSNTPWADDEKAETRLGQEQQTLRLVRITSQAELRPWTGRLWNRGDVQAPAKYIESLLEADRPTNMNARTWAQRFEATCNEMPDRGRSVMIIPLHQHNSEGTFRTNGVDGKCYDWIYDERIGLRRQVLGD